ncbi:MAG: ATP-dependent helicase C-terminal domain-containing protein, partial [Verrucomicrobiota bacterium]
ETKLALLEQICLGAFSYKQIKDRPVLPTLQTILSSEQRPLIEHLAPTRIPLPHGKKGRIRYEEGRNPILSAQLQHLYDLSETPSLADVKIKLTIEILAPNQRPVQVTDDLPSFWKNSYEQIKKDLKGRYPKQEWR